MLTLGTEGFEVALTPLEVLFIVADVILPEPAGATFTTLAMVFTPEATATLAFPSQLGYFCLSKTKPDGTERCRFFSSVAVQR